jgi:fructose-bisphosphate aldolase, class II
MPLVNLNDMLQHAYTHHYAIGAFDLVSLDFLGGILDAAEAEQSPVILSLAESHFHHVNFDLVMPAVVAAAERAAVPVAVFLDHGLSLTSAIHAIRLGATGVMVDASHAEFAENVRQTAEIVAMAHGCGLAVEGELGYVAGVEGEDADLHPGEVVYTSPEEAHGYVQQTGVDFLAVSVGTVHGRMKGQPNIDFERLAMINATLSIPLVIHGGTGLSDAQYQQLIANGVAKINYYTALSDAAAEVIQQNVANQQQGFPGLLTGARAAIAKEVTRCMRLWGSANQAQSVQEQARAHQPVEHVIVFNPTGYQAEEIYAALEQGCHDLATIPGVTRVWAGKANREDARYPYAWIIRFSDPAVIGSYKHHPVHVRYADDTFRPMAEDRISMDYVPLT